MTPTVTDKVALQSKEQVIVTHAQEANHNAGRAYWWMKGIDREEARIEIPLPRPRKGGGGMTLQARPYIVVPMTVMDIIVHQLVLHRANCPEHLKGDVNFALKRLKETALYMHGDKNANANVEPANYIL